MGGPVLASSPFYQFATGEAAREVISPNPLQLAMRIGGLIPVAHVKATPAVSPHRSLVSS